MNYTKVLTFSVLIIILLSLISIKSFFILQEKRDFNPNSHQFYVELDLNISENILNESGFNYTDSPFFNKTYLVIGLVDLNISLYSQSRYTAMDILKANSLEVTDDWKISYPTLMLAEKWFKDEGAKYGKEANINFEIVGPYNFNYEKLSMQPTLSEFSAVIEKNKISLDGYDGILILFFHGSKAQRMSYQSGDFSYIDLQFSDTSYDIINIVKTIMHESVHMFGALDLYGNRGFFCDMGLGVPEPEKGYNQTRACIMCGAIAITSESDGLKGMQGITKIDDMVLCNETARQIHWVN